MLSIHRFSRRSALLAGAGVAALGVSGLMIGVRVAHATGAASGPSVVVTNTTAQAVPVAPQGTTNVSGTVGVSGTVNTASTIPSTQFSVATPLPLSGEALLSGPGPSGGRYAITSLVVSDSDSGPGEVFILLQGGTTSDCLNFTTAVVQVGGPDFVIPAHDTISVSFSQPFVTTAVAGNENCLKIVNNGSAADLQVTAVGYRIAP